MRASSRIGWVRLGVVLTVVWLTAVATYIAWELHTVGDELVATASRPPETITPPLPDGFEISGQQTLWVDCNLDAKRAVCSPRLLHTLSLAFLPIGVLWASGWAFLWVKAGFATRIDS